MASEKIYIHHFSVMAPAEIIERTMQFYRDILGIAPGHRPEFSLPGYWLYSGGVPIIHLTAKEDRTKGNPGYFHHLALRCKGVDEIIRRLSDQEIEYRRQDQDDVKQIQITVIDPAGNLVELNFDNGENA